MSRRTRAQVEEDHRAAGFREATRRADRARAEKATAFAEERAAQALRALLDAPVRARFVWQDITGPRAYGKAREHCHMLVAVISAILRDGVAMGEDLRLPPAGPPTPPPIVQQRDFIALDRRWSRSTLGWQLRHTSTHTTLYFVCGTGFSVSAIRRFICPESRKITIAECRAASEREARFNPIHAELVERYVIGKRYCTYDLDDQRYFIDAVWVPEFCEAPVSIRSYMSKGGCSTSPGDPGTWWLHVGYVGAKIAAAQLPGDQIGLFS